MPGRFSLRSTLRHKTILRCLFLVPFLAAPWWPANDWNYEETHSEAREFAPGGFVHVRLSVGDMHVRRGDSSKISVRYTIKSRHEKNLKEGHMEFDFHRSHATIEFHTPPGGNTQFDGELEVPEKTNLDV